MLACRSVHADIGVHPNVDVDKDSDLDGVVDVDVNPNSETSGVASVVLCLFARPKAKAREVEGASTNVRSARKCRSICLLPLESQNTRVAARFVGCFPGLRSAQADLIEHSNSRLGGRGQRLRMARESVWVAARSADRHFGGPSFCASSFDRRVSL